MAHNDADIPLFIGQGGQLNGQQWIVEQTLLFGRDKICDVSIPNRQVSRKHAKVYITPEGLLLEDLNSKNGTHCNGKKICEPTTIKDGDVIQIAFAQRFIFMSADSTLPLEDIQIEPVDEAYGDLRLEKRSRRVWIGTREVIPPLSASQFRLLESLFDHDGKVVPRDNLIIYVWGEDDAIAVSNQALDALVRRLRDRLSEIEPSYQYIVTVRGHGLRLDNPSL